MRTTSSPLFLTRHAGQRMRQRAINADMLALLLDYGHTHYCHNGCNIVAFNKKARRRIQRDLGKAAAQLHLSTYAVLSNDTAQVITVGHRVRRIRNDA